MSNILQSIESTALSPTTTKLDIVAMARDCKEYKFYGLCVPPKYIKYTRMVFTGKIISVIGFPFSLCSTQSKVREAVDACTRGVDELDVVMDFGHFKTKEYKKVSEELSSIRHKIPSDMTMKVIIESSLWTDDEIKTACGLCIDSGANFIKTSTGVAGRNVLGHIGLIRGIVGPSYGVKASGGITSYASALDCFNAGATRIGTSNATKIAKEALAVKDKLEWKTKLEPSTQQDRTLVV